VLCAGIKNQRRVFKNNTSVILESIDYLATRIPLNKACRIFNISTQQYYRWKNKTNCAASVLNLCYKTHPHQLTLAECSVIKEAIHDPANQPKKLSSILYRLMREGKIFCSLSTFYKYASLLSERGVKQKHNPQKQFLQSLYPFQFIHVDTTWLQTIKDGSVRAAIIKDNFSKKILHQGIVETGNSHTNNEIESTFNLFKNEFIASLKINDKEHAQQLLKDFQNYNDNERYPLALFGLTPQEVFEGAIPNKYLFANDIQQARKIRYQKNKAGRFCDVCSPVQ
jgi:hypothetical protein